VYVAQEGRSGLEIPLTGSQTARWSADVDAIGAHQIKGGRLHDQGGRLDAAVLEHEIHWLKSDESALRCLVFENMEPFCVGPWDCIFDLGASFMMLPQLRQLRFHAESTSRGSSAWSTALAPGRCSIDRITFRSARAACADFPQTGSTYVGKASVLRLALLS
jgi:hypothetical protein